MIWLKRIGFVLFLGFVVWSTMYQYSKYQKETSEFKHDCEVVRQGTIIVERGGDMTCVKKA